MNTATNLEDLASEILSVPESIRETWYCAVVDFYELSRSAQWDLMVYLAEGGWER